MLSKEKENWGAEYTIKMGLNLDMIQSSLVVSLEESDGEERGRTKTGITQKKLKFFFNSNQMQDFKMTKLFAQIWI